MSFFALTSTRGDLSVEWHPHVAKVSLEVSTVPHGGSTGIQMEISDAKEMYEKLGAAIARAESTAPCTDCGGRGLFRVIEGAELTRCETCMGEGSVPRA